MNLKFIAKYLGAGLACSSFIITTGQSVTGQNLLARRTAPQMEFRCEYDDDEQKYVTTAFGLITGKKVPPIIIWRTTEFGELTPKQRCEHVTQKLNYQYAQNGYYLKGLGVTHGEVGIEPYKIKIICLAPHGFVCNRKNHLFNVPSSAKNPEDYMEQINVAIRNLGGESESRAIYNTGGETRMWIPLVYIEDYLEKEEDYNNKPSRPERPEPELPVCGEFC
ncbi:COP23 domain-containing protein [Moorena sp. SIO3B2]|uniref:COP23 domain-containing protein n=1 Tax=Moorena sp. SIO3B2 TaxID=2607827 RepID=UPI0013C83EFF|nr:COP23 domain-containing protein [Moorena sp. SIO3B2]NEP36548.1 hypothetical protein [Moorena sp. SIO3B2]